MKVRVTVNPAGLHEDVVIENATSVEAAQESVHKKLKKQKIWFLSTSASQVQ